MYYEYNMKKAVKQEAINTQRSLIWAVGWIVPAETQDDRMEKYHICAFFENPVNAEMFIDTLPAETRNRFFITRTT